MSKTDQLKGLSLILFMTTALILSGCDEPTTPPPQADDQGATAEDAEAVVDASNQFALDLYNRYRQDDGNIFFSPYSISTAFAMVYEGAKGTTAEQIKDVMHYPNDLSTLRKGSARIYNTINTGTNDYQLSTANALWAQEDYPFLKDYLENVARYYLGNTTNLDFAGDSEQSRQTINEWVEEKTNSRIKDLIPQGVLDQMTRLVLTNAIYFKGDWEIQFEKDLTQDEEFRISPDDPVDVPMMSFEDSDNEFNYYEDEDLQILEMPYKGEKISMLVLLPRGDDIQGLEDSLTLDNIKRWKSMMMKTEVDVYFPRFEFETKYMMAEDLKAMGMVVPFDKTGQADLSGMDGSRKLYIQSVIHQAYVKVDEKGTEAAAATAIAVGENSAPLNKIFRADHPFIFMIQERETGNILFMGRVNDPR
jgi:serpin B